MAATLRWIPEDDLLLKNAVEGGASLEALAKGAVQFSRRFTLRELRNRWYSLLYDPDISGQSSVQMFELEISGFNSSSKLIRPENILKGNKEIPSKRKSDNIRKKYHAMRKRIRNEILRNSDLGLFEPEPHEFSVLGAEFQKQVALDGVGQTSILRDCISDNLQFQEEDLDILRDAFPETVKDIAVDSGATYVSQTGYPNSFGHNCTNGIIVSSGFHENAPPPLPGGGNNVFEVNIKSRKGQITLKNCSRNENTQNASVGYESLQFKSSNSDGYSSQKTFYTPEKPLLRHLRVQDVSALPVAVGMNLPNADQIAECILSNDADGQENRTVGHTVEYADPDSLLNLSNEDGILLFDIDETHAEDVSCSNNIVSAIHDSHIDDQVNDVAMVDIETMTGSEITFLPALATSPIVLETAASSGHGEEQINHPPEINISSNSADISDGKICCLLNSEDTEIPCNDDIFLLIHPSTSFGSYATQLDIKGSMDAFSAAHGKNNEQSLNFPTKSKDSVKVFAGPLNVGIHRLPESHSTHQLPSFLSKTEIPGSRPNTMLSGFSYKNNGDSSKGALVNTNSNAPCDWLNEKDVGGVAMKVRDSPRIVTEMIESTEACSGRIMVPESVLDASGSDQEDSLIDVDVPYFSDIEAMILEMDLDPYDQDVLITRQVPSYTCDDTKRTIIRLEQGARSCLQRIMTAEGALAILYGRYLRHYIRKPEVVLGRSTEDVDVDIDLRKEGWANKISRRQAIIKMENDGSFLLKNLGKSSISVNGTVVVTGQLLNLSSSCLIEIQGMSFVFEINQRYLKQCSMNLNRKKKGGSIKPERFP